jgi:hypothetical protein
VDRKCTKDTINYYTKVLYKEKRKEYKIKGNKAEGK